MRTVSNRGGRAQRRVHLIAKRKTSSDGPISDAEMAIVRTAALKAGKGRSEADLELLEARPMSELPLPQDRNSLNVWILEVYDHAAQHLVTVRYNRRKRKVLDAAISRRQPRPTLREIRAAREIVAADATARGERVKMAAAMPPTSIAEPLNHKSPRLINIAVTTLDEKLRQRKEIVGVNIRDSTIHHYESGNPQGTRAAGRAGCDAPPSSDTEPVTNTPGDRIITIHRNGLEIWRALIVRPAASSGTNGSGIELRDVKFGGDLVLERAHVPILNVKYDADLCGPYRDWQNWETPFEAFGVDVSPGFRQCTTEPRTIMESGVDQGNFTGVAIFEDESGVHLVSEMMAGWYRYVSRWTFTDNGILKCRFGFAAVNDTCVCNRHHHHAYWRFQFNMKNMESHFVTRVENAGGNENIHPVMFETTLSRDKNPPDQIQIQPGDLSINCRIRHGADDGSAIKMPDWPYGRGDAWVLRHRDIELDDGSIATGPPYEAGLDRFLDNEALSGHRVAVWYAGHFTHDLSEMDAARHGHMVGPDLIFSKI
jgi:hypothetical protein